MKCNVCGQDYGLAHSCSGVAASMSQEEAAPAPSGFAPGYYLRLAIGIVSWDDVSIRRASRDPKSLFYGASFWTVAALVILLFTAVPQMLKAMPLSGPATIIGLAIGLLIGLLIMAAVTVLQLGLCHLIAKTFLGGTGTIIGVLRPLLLAWFVNVLILVPVAGNLAAGIAWTAVLMLVFEEIDGIGRIQAFLVSAGINVCFFVLQFMAMPLGRQY